MIELFDDFRDILVELHRAGARFAGPSRGTTADLAANEQIGAKRVKIRVCRR